MFIQFKNKNKHVKLADEIKEVTVLPMHDSVIFKFREEDVSSISRFPDLNTLQEALNKMNINYKTNFYDGGYSVTISYAENPNSQITLR